LILSVIKLTNIAKSYQERVILAPLSLEIPSQQSLALIGPSGCGKSTLLRIILGLIEPNSGTIEIEGQQLTKDNCRLMRQKIGYVIQDGGLFPHLTASQNVTLMARQLTPTKDRPPIGSWDWSPEKINFRLLELAKLVHLPETLLNRYPAEMSGGQRQRVGIMRALMLDPSILILDEPMGALDPLVRHQLQKDLKDIFQQLRKTVLLVTHDMGEAAFLADQIALLKDGYVVQKGTFQELVDQPADPFVTEFFQAQRAAW
jgi:osmoprotectant transport system ATP-binding protein